ncbi:REPEAT-CONTAINING PROTEIN putative-RELATED [Salix koriyanagi]|uniref:REPEAT-CONTAINING PROTEIN putative-RELATED n=1 Tax=Salix koriyanagi TaxID=2511006 RepID=A0A9Q0W7D6_9ROSI|nr:REPEAT-CONTAINING PROTEIN putative-RELATED [Salix koriyanagi]
MHNCFPMLKELDLSGNIFAIIPETLSLFTHLKSLRLNKCKKLQEIPALPRNIKRLEARDCELLERYSPLDKEGEWPAQLRVVDFSNCHKLAKNEGKNMEDAFFSKALHQKFQVEMFLPGSKILEWFAFTSEQGSLTYLVPSPVFEKIQGLVICSILCLEDGMTANISCEMFVDGKSMILCSRHFFPLETDHMWLYHQPYCYTRALGSARNDLVCFEISFEVLGAPRGSALKILNPRVSRRKTADDQCGEQFSFSLQPMDQKPGNPLIASKSGEHQLEHWLSLSLQPMDVSNWDPMCIKKLEEKVQLQPQRKQKMNFFNELGRTPIGEHADVEYETKKDETDISDVESLA